MSLYSEFVRQHIRSAPGSNQKEKMQAVARMWQQQKGHIGAKKRGKGTGSDIEGGDATMQGNGMQGGCANCQGGSGRKRRKGRRGGALEGGELEGGELAGGGRKKRSRGRRGGEIVAPAESGGELRGGAYMPANPLAAGNMGVKPSQSGFGILGSLGSIFGLGLRPEGEVSLLLQAHAL